MLKYNYSYKYVNFKNDDVNIIIQLSFDNIIGKGIYAAKTNILFKDEYGDWGHACGIGDTEEEALSMCIGEINSYLTNFNIVSDNLTEIKLPKKFIFLDKKQTIVLYITNKNDNQIILTSKDKVIIDKNINIVLYITKNKKQFLHKSIENLSLKFFNKYELDNIFDNMSTKFEV